MRVGRKIKEIIDFNREESLSEVKENRKFMISIFYPVDSLWKEEKTPVYLDLFSPQDEEAERNFRNIGVRENYLRDLTINCYNDAPISENYFNSPVIIYSPGMGIDRDMYLFNISRLVLEGYIVVTVGSTYDTLFTVFPNKEIVYQSKIVQDSPSTNFTFLKQLIDIRIDDISLLLDSLSVWNETDTFFRRRFDLNRVGVIGHSLGGATIYELANRDVRIKAGIILDGSLHLISHEKKIDKPFMSIRQEKSSYEQMKQVWSNEIAEAYSNGQQLLYDVLTGDKLFLKIKDSDHMSFTDVPVIFNHNDNLDESVKVVHDTINELTIAFFEQFLNGKDTSFFEWVNSKTNNPNIYVIDCKGEVV
ncbi:hypothetical protein [Cytobacillus sp. IB215316]|uniref:alpha/beta hydrolase family protein n=1 Tax=Cytobacillus sp. IB215316 TaxID=3097354 RepID=UPI002A13E0D5|nr:hypothetical protein [Cytobacillus sp. IB215316]MDX8362988.1 hypothetical protein [Cytobacillus sp. IB215316]